PDSSPRLPKDVPALRSAWPPRASNRRSGFSGAEYRAHPAVPSAVGIVPGRPAPPCRRPARLTKGLPGNSCANDLGRVVLLPDSNGSPRPFHPPFRPSVLDWPKSLDEHRLPAEAEIANCKILPANRLRRGPPPSPPEHRHLWDRPLP